MKDMVVIGIEQCEHRRLHSLFAKISTSFCTIAGYGCIDPSGMVAPWSDLALANCLAVTVVSLRLA